MGKAGENSELPQTTRFVKQGESLKCRSLGAKNNPREIPRAADGKSFRIGVDASGAPLIVFPIFVRRTKRQDRLFRKQMVGRNGKGEKR